MYYSITMLLSLLLVWGISASYKIQVWDSDDRLHQCEVRVIDELFGGEELVYFIFSNNDYEMLPFDIVNSKVIINVSDTQDKIHVPSHYSTKYTNFSTDERLDCCKPYHDVISTEFARNFIFQIGDFGQLTRIMDYLKRSTIWNNNESPRGTFLIITAYPEIERFFPILWKLYIRKVVILGNKGENVIKLYTANANDQGNKCGKIAKVYSHALCEDPQLNIVYQNTLKNYGGCPVSVPHGYSNYTDTSKITHFMTSTFDALRRYCNVVLDQFHDDETHSIMYSSGYIIDEGCLFSYTLCQDNWFFIVPIPDRISGLAIYTFIFQKELWILELVSFFFTVAVWLLIQTHNNGSNSLLANLSLTFFDVFSVTVWGNISRFPSRLAMRFLCLSYIIYSMHIQTAYVSMLIRVLTVPQYGRGIATLRELAYSDIPLCINNGAMMFYSAKIPEYEAYTKIQNKIRNVSRDYQMDIEYIHKYNNCSTVTFEGNLLEWQMNNNHTLDNKLIDGNSIMTPLNYYLVVNHGSYLVDTVNYIIIALKESGIFTKIENDWALYNSKKLAERTIDLEPTVLSMNHLFGVFVIWGFGMLMSIIVFFLELTVNKWSRAT